MNAAQERRSAAALIGWRVRPRRTFLANYSALHPRGVRAAAGHVVCNRRQFTEGILLSCSQAACPNFHERGTLCAALIQKAVPNSKVLCHYPPLNIRHGLCLVRSTR